LFFDISDLRLFFSFRRFEKKLNPKPRSGYFKRLQVYFFSKRNSQGQAKAISNYWDHNNREIVSPVKLDKIKSQK